MFTWLAENIGTIIVVIILLCIVTAILAVRIHNRRLGKSSCGCNCQHCAMSGSCHSKRNS